MSAWRHLRFVVVILVGIAAVACTEPTAASTSTVASIQAPATSSAGEPIEVEVEVAGDGDIVLEVTDAYVRTLFTDRASPSGIVTFVVPAEISRSSGLLTFRATGAVGETVAAETMVEPAALADPLGVVVGPRTVIANGADETMAVVFATDRFGNPMPDGTRLDLNLIDERGETTLLDATIDGGVAGRRIGSGTVAQAIDVFASDQSDSISSRRVGFDEVAGPAVDVAVMTTGPIPFADGRSLVSLETTVLTDRFGNVMPDGRIVQLQTDGPDGVGQLTARTIGGVASFSMAAPSRPGTVIVTPVVDEVTGAGLAIEVTSAIAELPFVVDRSSAQGSFDPESVGEVSIGPVIDAAGAVVVDGTVADVTLLSENFEVWSSDVQLVDGRAVIEVPRSVVPESPDEVAVEVLGTRRDEGVVAVNRSDDVTVHRLRDGSVGKLKRLIALLGAGIVVAAVVAALAAASAAVLGTGDGADPDRAFSPTANGTDAFDVDVVWAPDAVLDREMEPATRELLADAWVRAAEAIDRAAAGDTSGLEVWFIDGALDAILARLDLGGDASVIAPPADRHDLGVDFYSLDGQIVVLTAVTSRADRPDERVEAIVVLSETATGDPASRAPPTGRDPPDRRTR